MWKKHPKYLLSKSKQDTWESYGSSWSSEALFLEFRTYQFWCLMGVGTGYHWDSEASAQRAISLTCLSSALVCFPQRDWLRAGRRFCVQVLLVRCHLSVFRSIKVLSLFDWARVNSLWYFSSAMISLYQTPERWVLTLDNNFRWGLTVWWDPNCFQWFLCVYASVKFETNCRQGNASLSSR